MQELHPLLRKQWKRYMAEPTAIVGNWLPFLTAVSRAYQDTDADRCLLERAIELSNREVFQANTELRGILDVLPDSLFRITPENRLIHLSNSGSGWIKELLSDFNGSTTAACPASASFWTVVAEVRAHPRVMSYEFTTPLEHGEKSCEIRLLPFVDGELVGVARDTTQRKLAENALHRSQQELLTANAKLAATNRQLRVAERAAQAASNAKSEFLANMSHEVRTPLNGILGLTELVLSTSLASEQRDLLETAYGSAETLLLIVNDILDLSKMEAGKLELEMLDVDIRQLIEFCAKSFVTRAYRKGVELLSEVDPRCPMLIRADPTRVRQVIWNLLSNAVKFTVRGQILLRVSPRRHQGKDILNFAVADTGPGIPSHRRSSIFQAFSQADASITRVYGGTGLGLAIAQRLVQLMDGDLWLRSSLRRGSVFHFSVPLIAVAVPRPLDPELAGRRALVIDGSPSVRQILKRMMDAWAMEVSTAPNGVQALQALSELASADTSPQVILLDAAASEPEILDLMAAIRAVSQAFVILLLPPVNSPLGVDRCHGLGLECLTKPVGCGELLEVVRRLLLSRQTVEPDAAQSRPPLAMQRSLRILVAEDNPVNQKVVRKLLERKGHRVTIAENGRRALELFREQWFDLILMDVQMPEVDGMEATRRIRAEERDGDVSHTPIVALTAHAMKGDAQRCLEAGMDAYLPKPIRSEDLFDLIGSMARPRSSSSRVLRGDAEPAV